MFLNIRSLRTLSNFFFFLSQYIPQIATRAHRCNTIVWSRRIEHFSDRLATIIINKIIFKILHTTHNKLHTGQILKKLGTDCYTHGFLIGKIHRLWSICLSHSRSLSIFLSITITRHNVKDIIWYYTNNSGFNLIFIPEIRYRITEPVGNPF